ncbi:hypothetical protein [uncultured Ruminococcus sp.]|uniref:hypothetical protein n=1 Tax=uncultured Ruminococcus sp. TaxID=165186 RepID=UPI0025E29F27|nr:hypothetical protein [uncultured Ruminococcus sp.]
MLICDNGKIREATADEVAELSKMPYNADAEIESLKESQLSAENRIEMLETAMQDLILTTLGGE